MTTRHPPLAQLVGGPCDGEVRPCGLVFGFFLPDGFDDPTSPEGTYCLVRPVQHGDRSLCGGIYEWRLR